MTFQRFFLFLSLVSICVILINMSLPYWVLSLQNHAVITWWSLYLFIIISVLMYLMGKKAVGSTNILQFNNTIITFFILKMFLSIGLIFYYKKTFHPSGSAFVLPFIITYVFFTVFETYFMMQFTRTKKSM